MKFKLIENIITERLEKLTDNSYITDSVYDIKNLITNKSKLYRILYDRNIDKWMIGDGYNLVHYDMFRKAYNDYYYADQQDFIDSIGTYNNYWEIGLKGSFEYNEDDIEPYLYCLIFIPNNSDSEDEIICASDDNYQMAFDYGFGTICTRDCDLYDTPLIDVLEAPSNEYRLD